MNWFRDKVKEYLKTSTVKNPVPTKVTYAKLSDIVGTANASISTIFREKGTSWSSGWHNGVDIAAAQGTAIKAVADGTVINVDTHYVSSTAAGGTECKAGKAKITLIASGTVHPYHLKAESGGGSTVCGWVDSSDVAALGQKTVNQIALEVKRGDWGNGDERVKRLTAAGYDAKVVQGRVDVLMK